LIAATRKRKRCTEYESQSHGSTSVVSRGETPRIGYAVGSATWNVAPLSPPSVQIRPE
jgi:hypothetical protein